LTGCGSGLSACLDIFLKSQTQMAAPIIKLS
jgi:hypothetical protein